MTHEAFQKISHTLPHHPGIYKYFDKENQLLYVGKAKDLRKRISSYFNKNYVNYKTHELVTRIEHIEFTIVDSEKDALLLENSLIKSFKPKFNIDLKDDKTYPYIVIKNEPFPRVFFTRRKFNDKSQYLGPFTSVGKVRELLDYIKFIFPLRTCRLPLNEKNIGKNKFKVCLEYHLGNCKGPCEGLQTEAEYNNNINQVKNFLKGNVSAIEQHYKSLMEEHVEKLEFEKAALIKKKLEFIEAYSAKSVIVGIKDQHLDIFTLLKDGNICYVNYLMVESGAIVHTQTVELDAKLDEADEEVLSFAVNHLRLLHNSMASEIIVPFPIETSDATAIITVPKGGDKKKLLDLSLKNVNYFKEEIKRRKNLFLENKTQEDKNAVLEELRDFLKMKLLPSHIECFDNSNFQGSFPVSAMVCFKEGIPSKEDYRHYNIKEVEGINDFESMKEVVKRRYTRVLEEGLPFPSLIIIDGGKGQLSSAMEALDSLEITQPYTIIGLAKNVEEIFFPDYSDSLKLPWDSSSLKLLRRIRDEVHRFGITFHRKKRSKGTFKNELENINGIGKKTTEQLLKTFKSVRNIKEASEQDLVEAIGKSRTSLLLRHLGKQTKEND